MQAGQLLEESHVASAALGQLQALQLATQPPLLPPLPLHAMHTSAGRSASPQALQQLAAALRAALPLPPSNRAAEAAPPAAHAPRLQALRGSRRVREEDDAVSVEEARGRGVRRARSPPLRAASRESGCGTHAQRSGGAAAGCGGSQAAGWSAGAGAGSALPETEGCSGGEVKGAEEGAAEAVATEEACSRLVCDR
jgi:hypothetical protein